MSINTVVTLKKGEGRTLSQGGLWVFDNEIETIKGHFKNGALVKVEAFNHYPLGIGYINQNSKIRVRLLSRQDTKINEDFFRMRLKNAWEYRKRTVDTSSLPSYVLNPVTVRSQVAPENGSIGPVICSATTTSMILSYLGTNEATLTTAKGVYDKAFDGYGNWVFNMNYAGNKGYLAYDDFYDLDMLKYTLAQGTPVGCSIKISSGQMPEAGYTTAGHLVLVVGYETRNGVDYLIVNDPNINASSTRRCYYKCANFIKCWYKTNNLGVVYIVQNEN